MHISWRVKIRNLVKALKYIPEQKSHLTRAILPQNKAFYQENQANENLPRNYYYAYPLYCAHSLWSCNKVLSGRGQGYFCARDELSISFWNLSAWNLYMSPLICCWSMKSTKCFFFLLSEICFEFDWLKNSWVKFPLSDLICYSRIHQWQTSNNKGIEAMFDRRLNGWPHIILSMPWLSQRSHCFKVSVQLKPLR